MKPKWPSIEKQLEADNVTRDSALEQLIKDNQDFDLLQPEEANDDAGLPLWLRVYWRKNHPELQHPTVNPGAGYPDILYNIYQQMLSQHDLPWENVSGASQGTQTPPENPDAEGSKQEKNKEGE